MNDKSVYLQSNGLPLKARLEVLYNSISNSMLSPLNSYHIHKLYHYFVNTIVYTELDIKFFYYV